MNKKTSASNNSIAAGGNIEINFNILVNNGIIAAIEEVCKIHNFPVELVDAIRKNVLASKFSLDELPKITKTIEMIKSNHICNNTVNECYNRFKSISPDDLNKIEIENLLQSVALNITKNDFLHAHKSLNRLLPLIKNNQKLYIECFNDYLRTGLIYSTLTNKKSYLISLFKTFSSKLPNQIDSTSEIIIASIIQEVATRSSDVDMLKKATGHLKVCFNKCTDTTSRIDILNSLGLAYRRIGERGNFKVLQKSLDILNEAYKTSNEGKIKPEICNNIGITHVRLYEVTKSDDHLAQAEQFLNESISRIENLDCLSNFTLYPKVLNNLGNVYKEKFLKTGKKHCGNKAINYYSKAQEIWTEKVAPYEWATVEKNIGQTKLYIGKNQRSIKTLREALYNCEKSLQYRNYENSPYQWSKTVQVIFDILKEISLLDSANEIKQKITYYSAIITDKKSHFPISFIDRFDRIQ